MVCMKQLIIIIVILFYSSLFVMAVTSGDFQYTKTTENKIDDFGNEKQVKVCIIDSFTGLEEIRNTCNLKQKDTKAFSDFCQELASNPDCECVKPVSPIRSSCIGEVLNQTIFQGQNKGSSLPCLPRGTSLNWILDWNITKDDVDFTWCKI